jgi:hypothetical protein
MIHVHINIYLMPREGDRQFLSVCECARACMHACVRACMLSLSLLLRREHAQSVHALVFSFFSLLRMRCVCVCVQTKSKVFFI